jgi:hypothetical protein
MTLKGILTVPLVLLFGLGQTGCSSTQQPAHDHAQESGAAQHNHTGQSTEAPSNDQTAKAIQDELGGLSSIEAAVNKGDFDSASKTFAPLHDEYHAAVLPPIKQKNAKLAEDMHSKFDELDSALDSKDKSKILSAIKANKDSLNKAAKVLGISIK